MPCVLREVWLRAQVRCELVAFSEAAPAVAVLDFLRRMALPEPKAADEGVGVVAGAAAFGKLLQFLDVAAAKHDVISMDLGHEVANDIWNVFPPCLLAQSSQRMNADIILVDTFLYGSRASSLDSAAPLITIAVPRPVPSPMKSSFPPL